MAWPLGVAEEDDRLKPIAARLIPANKEQGTEGSYTRTLYPQKIQKRVLPG